LEDGNTEKLEEEDENTQELPEAEERF